MSGRASRRKGSRGELEVAAIFQRHGFDARRTPNSGGLSWRGDVQGVPGYSIEVKRQETLSIPAWLRQAYAAASGGEVPVVVFRRDGRGTTPDGCWHAIVPLEELSRLIAAAGREHETSLRLCSRCEYERLGGCGAGDITTCPSARAA